MGLIKDFIESQKAEDEFAACRKVVQRHFQGLENARQIDPFRLAASKKIIVHRCANTPYEGVIERDCGGLATINIRRGLSRRRERFTLAHEIGHWLLQEEMIGTTEGKLFRGLSQNSAEVSEEERLASLLAAELLMPLQPIRTRYQDGKKLESLRLICRDFGVSRTAAVRRIADVCNKNMLLLQLVPYLFARQESAVEIDDAIFASSRAGTLFDRDRTKLQTRKRFVDVVSKPTHFLTVTSPKGLIEAEFEVEIRPDPILHAFALASLASWPNERISGARELRSDL